MDNLITCEDTNFSDDINLMERALHNSLIFQSVLDFIPTPHWRSVRLVCTTWEELTRAKWRKKVILQIKGVTQVTFIDNQIHPSSWNCVTMKQILEQILHVNTNGPNDPWNLIKHPFQNVRICPNVPIGTNDEIETTFWTIFGPQIKRLYLEQISVPRGGAPQLCRILGEQTPNLEQFSYSQHILTNQYDELVLGDVISPCFRLKLALIIINVEDMTSNNASYRCHLETYSNTISPLVQEFLRHRAENILMPTSPPDSILFPLTWELFLGICPNIKNICSTHNVSNAIEKQLLVQQIKQIKAIRENDKSALNIESWVGNLYPAGDIMTKFCALTLPLKSFAGNIVSFREGEGVHEFLTTHENTLKSLTVQGFGSDSVYAPPLWLPEGLTYLEMNVSSSGCKLDFLGYTPNLETFILNISTYNSVETGCTPTFGQMHISPLKHMTGFSCAFNLDEATFGRCVSLMPNLKKVKIGMDDKRWIMASAGWSSLEWLEVVDNICQDEHPLVLSEEAFVKFADGFINLKTFAVRTPRTRALFGEMSIYDGFLKMPALQHLSVKFLPQVNPSAISLLKKNIPVVNC